MDENIILDWKEANAELYSKFKHDLEEQLQKPYHQTILDISDGNAEPLQSVVLKLTDNVHGHTLFCIRLFIFHTTNSF